MSTKRNLVPQSLGFHPGTSLIGNFGSTERRFRESPNVLPVPGPGAYQPRNAACSVAPTWSWGTSAGHVNAAAEGAAEAPGPGTYGEEQHPCGDLLTGLRRQWPGIAAKSSFGSNAPLPTVAKTTGSGVPGPGQYNPDESSYFLSGPGAGGARSPFIADARARTGSRLRDNDIKMGAVFSSSVPAHLIPGVDGVSGSDRPGPGAHSPFGGTIDAASTSQRRAMALRADGGYSHSFGTTAARFRAEGGPSGTISPNLGPGTHTISRWSGEKPSMRRPRHGEAASTTGHVGDGAGPQGRAAGGAARSCGFLSSTERFAPLASSASSATDADAVVRFLAAESSGPIGQPLSQQAAMRAVRSGIARQGAAG